MSEGAMPTPRKNPDFRPDSATPGRAQATRRLLGPIQNRLVIAFLLVSTVPLVAVSIYGARSHLRVLEQLAFDSAREEAALRARKLQDALAAAQSDLLYLTQVPSLDSFIDVKSERSDVGSEKPTSNDSADAATTPHVEPDYARSKLAKQFEAFIASRSAYRAAAYVDNAGHELVRVRRTGTTVQVDVRSEASDWRRVEPASEGSVTAASTSQLTATQTAVHDLLAEGGRLLAGQTLVRLDAEAPEPVVRFVARLFPRGLQQRGMVMLEIALADLWDPERQEHPPTRVTVFDEQGHTILGEPGEIPAPLLQRLEKRPLQPTETPDGNIMTLVPVYPNRGDASQQWDFVAITSRSVVLAALNRYRLVFALVLLGTLAVATAVSILLARQFTTPLQRLYHAAQQIGRGRFDVPLTGDTADEIGGLARELRSMADQLKLRQDGLQQQIDEKTTALLAAERLSTIGRMSAAIAHEVNNPLGIISLYSQLLVEQTPPSDPRLEKLTAMSREAARMSSLVKGLLQLARSREPACDLRLADVDLAALIEEAVTACSSLQTRTDRVVIRRQIDDDARAIQADSDQMSQVLRNVIANALHALPEGGEITIMAAPDGTDHIAIRVSDTGQGIDPHHLPHVFEPFFTTRRFGSGTGLGLAVSKEIVERHGGTISVTSVPGQGTTFMIVLPRTTCRGTS